jgi:ABC-type proline/glycine betaine transport system permease subunit
LRPDAHRDVDKNRRFISSSIVMNLSVTTISAAIGSSSLSAVVVSAVTGAPRGF